MDDNSSPSFENVGAFGPQRAANSQEEDPDFDKDICDGDLEENLDSIPDDGQININYRAARMAHFGSSQTKYLNPNNQADYHLSRIQKLDLRAQQREGQDWKESVPFEQLKAFQQSVEMEKEPDVDRK